MKRILFIGDSITDSERKDRDNVKELGEGYVNLVAADLTAKYYDYEILNAGIGGNTVLNLLARWKKDCIDLKPDVLSIYVGINDCWRNYYEVPSGDEPEMFEKVYRILLDEVKNKLPNTKIILIGPHITHGFETDAIFDKLYDGIAINRGIAEKLAEEYGHYYINAQKIFDDAIKNAPDSHWTKDGVHPTPAGHRLIANEWEKVFDTIEK